ncbi:MAG: hypothetical protein WCJ02_04845 [bacterium]
MKRKITIVGVAILALCAVAVAIAEGTVIGNWRMHTVARQLEKTTALCDAYGPSCSVIPLERGLQPGSCFHMRVYHITPFRVQGDGVDKTIQVKWSNRDRGFDVRVHEFTEEHTPYTNFPPALK